jgi:hypothetical protein
MFLSELRLGHSLRSGSLVPPRFVLCAAFVGCGFWSAGCSNGTTSPSPPAFSVGLSCGEERWAVKTLSDPDATRVDFANVIATSVAALNDLAPHCSNLPERRTFPEEFQVFEVTARVSLTRLEDDRDVHIVVADPANPTRTMITEVIDPECQGALQSPFIFLLVYARKMYETLNPLAGKTVRLRGVGFYDFNHGQTGRSASCIELHPVTGVALAP